MKKVMLITVVLMALIISVPVVMARDASQDSIKQEWKAIKALQKQQEARCNAIKLLQTLGAKATAS